MPLDPASTDPSNAPKVEPTIAADRRVQFVLRDRVPSFRKELLVVFDVRTADHSDTPPLPTLCSRLPSRLGLGHDIEKAQI